MDGNGRWASQRGLLHAEGYRAGAETLRSIVEAAPRLNIAVLTVYAFSSDNWKRPPEEVDALMFLLACYLEKESTRMRDAGCALPSSAAAIVCPRRCWLRSGLPRPGREPVQTWSCGLPSIIPRGLRFWKLRATDS